MNATNDWNPNLYLKFKDERTQPSIDLVTKIKTTHDPGSIIDIGCGPGNSTQVLFQRWPNAKVTGLDNSPAMIDKAKHDFPDQTWIIADAGTFTSQTKFDLVFSNATIQWVPNHSQLLKNLSDLLKPDGILAIQIPMFWDMPIGQSIDKVACNPEWKSHTDGVKDLFTIHDYHFYFDVLSSIFPVVDMWETFYMHVLDSQESILEMIRSTGLKPYLERLTRETDKQKFESEVFSSIKKDYPVQKNGKVIFPFKRLFFIGYK